MPVPVSALILAASTGIELWATFIKNSQTMTVEEANAAWADVQAQVRREHELWDKMVAEIHNDSDG